MLHYSLKKSVVELKRVWFEAGKHLFAFALLLHQTVFYHELGPSLMGTEHGDKRQRAYFDLVLIKVLSEHQL